MKYLKYWLGKKGLSLIERCTKTSKILTDTAAAAGNRFDTYFNLLEEKCKPKVNKIPSVMALWSPQSHRNSMPLNEWITKEYNMVQVCKYPDVAKNQIIRDVLISGCKSTKVKGIIREPGKPNLERVITILQIKESTIQSMQNMISDEDKAAVHYARYDSKSKKRANKNGNSTSKENNSKMCLRCGNHKAHLKNSSTKEAEC